MAASSTSMQIVVSQRFSRSALGALWERRKDFDATTVEMLDSLYKNRKKGGNTEYAEQKVVYQLSRSKAGQLGFGRLYGSKSSLEHLQAECRASLCKDLYYDLDIVNCQPTILSQLINKELGADMPELDKYIDSRDAFLLKLMEANGVSRDNAKTAVITIMYGAMTRDLLLTAMSNEVRAKAKELSRLGKYTELFDALKHEKNHYGSFLAFVLQTEERKCMLAMRKFLTDRSWHVDVLAYDGVMVRRREDETITEDLLIEMMMYVKEETGYSIQIKEKEQVGFDLPQHYEDPSETAYRDMKAEFEKDHFYFIPTNTVCHVSREDGMMHFSLEHAAIRFNHMLLPGSKKDDDELFIKRWIKDPSRRFVQRLVYKKQEDCSPEEASMFTGFAYETMEGDDENAVPIFMDILQACCGDDAVVADYVLKYMAHIIQKPFEIPGTAIIFSSHTHGTGKDTLLNMMRALVGRHSKHYGSETQFWNSHDTGKEGALLIHLEEVGARANKAKADELKALITANSISINPKGIKAYDVPNVARLMMTTNVPDPVKLEASDRRFLIVNPSDRLHARGLSWWASIQARLKSDAFLHTVGKRLENEDLTDWNPRTMPITDVKKELLELSKPQGLQFLEEMVEELSEAKTYSGLDLFKEYRRWYVHQGMPAEFAYQSANSFGMNILVYKDKLYTKKKTDTGVIYTLYPKSGMTTC